MVARLKDARSEHTPFMRGFSALRVDSRQPRKARQELIRRLQEISWARHELGYFDYRGTPWLGLIANAWGSQQNYRGQEYPQRYE